VFFFQQQYKRLDKNLKSENSENDLLMYLQNKQMRTRRMSQALWNTPISESPEASPMPAASRQRRKSLAPVVATNNYIRRLSLAAPMGDPHMARRRGVSAGNVLKGIDSPGRRRLHLRRNFPSTSSDDRTEGSALSPLAESDTEENETKPAGVSFALENEVDTPNKKVKEGDMYEKRRGNTGAIGRILRGKSKHGSFKRNVGSDSSPDSRRGGSLKEKHTKPLKEGGTIPEDRSPKEIKAADKSVRFVSPKKSPSAARRNRFGKAHSVTFDTGPKVMKHFASVPETTEQDESAEPGETSPTSGIRKNLSYNRALFSDIVAEDDEL